MYSILSLEPTERFLPNEYRFTIGRVQNTDKIVVILALFLRSQ